MVSGLSPSVAPMANAHAAREHSQWSASSTERNWQCPGSLALTDGLPETTSEAADWGTACHQIAERCLHDGGNADRYIGTIEKAKSYSFEVDEEMAETAQMYVDYVRQRIDSVPADAPVITHYEQHFTLNSLKPPFDAGGTADAVLYFPTLKLIEVIDLKGGRGVVVEVTGNPQARSYALGAMLANPGIDVERIRTTIVQPRAPHRDGRIRSEEFHIADLVEWTTDLVAAMRRAKEAMDTLASTSQGEWSTKFLNAGDHCKFCKAKATCPAIEQKAIDTVGIWFDDLNQPRFANTPPSTDPAERAMKLDMLDMIEGWIAAFRENEHRLAEAGDPADGYILVPKQGREKWNEGVEEQVIGAAIVSRLPEEKYLTPGKLRTPKQIRKELGKNANLVEGLSSTPEAGTNLVRATKTTRDAVPGTAARFFEPQPN